MHSAQCLVYHGPDTKYEGGEICYGYNEVSPRANYTVGMTI